jgi:hypothetical protein
MLHITHTIGAPQMTTDTTDITIVLDRTGSMQAIRDDAIAGFNAFLTEQKAHPTPATLTLCSSSPMTPTRSSTTPSASPRSRS